MATTRPRLQWDQIKPDFSNSAASMRNAMTGISEAGTVFDRIRDDIAAEEQAALEAAYKQQVFDENVRQFDLEQAWNRENAEAERLFQEKQDERNHRRARELTQLRFGLEEGARNKSTSAYNALNTFFMDYYKKTGDLVKAADATRAFHNANYGNVLFDDDKIFGNLAGAVAQGYSPENRFLRGWTTIREGATAESELPGIDKTLKGSYNGFFTKDGIVMQVDANGNVLPVSNTPERKQFLDLNSDKTRYTQMGQGARDFLKSLNFSPLEINRILSNTASRSAEDQEDAILAIASRLGITQPDKLPVINTVMKAAETSRTVRSDAAKAEKEREKLYTPDAYNKAYQEVYDEAVKAGKDTFDISKNPELNASIKLIGEAMRKAKKPASEFKMFLKQIKNYNYNWYEFKHNEDINSEGLNHPVLKAARAEYLPNLGKPTVEKPEVNKTGNSGVGNTNNNLNTSKTSGTEKLRDSDTRLATTVIKNLKSQRYALQQIANERDGKDRKQIENQLAYLDAAITSLQNNTPITVSNSDAYAYLRNILNRVEIYNTTADAQGNAVFTQDRDVASRYLRLMGPQPSK